jgi:hypothetical protein
MYLFIFSGFEDSSTDDETDYDDTMLRSYVV